MGAEAIIGGGHPAESGISANVLVEHVGDASPLQGKVWYMIMLHKTVTSASPVYWHRALTWYVTFPSDFYC